MYLHVITSHEEGGRGVKQMICLVASSGRLQWLTITILESIISDIWQLDSLQYHQQLVKTRAKRRDREKGADLS